MKLNQAEIQSIKKYHPRDLRKRNCPNCGGYLTAVQRFDGYSFAGSCNQCDYKWDNPLEEES